MESCKCKPVAAMFNHNTVKDTGKKKAGILL